MRDDAKFFSGLVWLIGATSLVAYSTTALTFGQLPGVEQLVLWLDSLKGWWILLAVFVTVFLEGLYFLGNFFPGTTVVLLLVFIAQATSLPLTFLTMLVLLVGWILSGWVNIVLAKQLRVVDNSEIPVHDRIWVTWLPSFRANHEVSQVVSGANPWRVFWSSVRVKIVATFMAAGTVFFASLFFDIGSVSNEEGFLSLYVFVVIMSSVGIYQIRQAYRISEEG